ncbi:hypothetical protein HF086_012120 [Spodoptera exigua]|uniref:SLC26A/SulP transporter domain-containing protein n=1 Tax=Spodoptera exigua TaxID=7107 RepID=A0A922SNR9_SPOEX|nr:hypothetical protein HF086_012120 [Spodoptera exigua]
MFAESEGHKGEPEAGPGVRRRGRGAVAGAARGGARAVVPVHHAQHPRRARLRRARLLLRHTEEGALRAHSWSATAMGVRCKSRPEETSYHREWCIVAGEVKPGLPELSAPPFSATVGNHTYTFSEMASTLGSAIFVVPLLSILENIALAKVFSEGKYVDATQEMVALGVCNVVSSLVHSMPVSGALSRGAVNHASGVATTAGGLYTGALVLLSLQYFTPYFYYIPKASLAAVIIAAVVFMMELHVFKPIWRTKKLDLIPAVVTFVTCLMLRLELGIVIGIAVNLVFLLYASAPLRQSDRGRGTAPHSLHLFYHNLFNHFTTPLCQPLFKLITNEIQHTTSSVDIIATHHHAAHITVCSNVSLSLTCVSACVQGIKALIDDFHARGQTIIFYNVKPSIAEVFRGVRPREFLHCSGRAQLDLLLRRHDPRAASCGSPSYCPRSLRPPTPHTRSLTLHFVHRALGEPTSLRSPQYLDTRDSIY